MDELVGAEVPTKPAHLDLGTPAYDIDDRLLPLVCACGVPQGTGERQQAGPDVEVTRQRGPGANVAEHRPPVHRPRREAARPPLVGDNVGRDDPEHEKIVLSRIPQVVRDTGRHQHEVAGSEELLRIADLQAAPAGNKVKNLGSTIVHVHGWPE